MRLSALNKNVLVGITGIFGWHWYISSSVFEEFAFAFLFIFLPAID